VGVAAIGALFLALLVKVALINNSVVSCQVDDVSQSGEVTAFSADELRLQEIERRLTTMEALLRERVGSG